MMQAFFAAGSFRNARSTSSRTICRTVSSVTRDPASTDIPAPPRLPHTPAAVAAVEPLGYPAMPCSRPGALAPGAVAHDREHEGLRDRDAAALDLVQEPVSLQPGPPERGLVQP